MDPVSMLVATATFLAADVARKPADELAARLWETVKAALRTVLDRDPTPSDVRAATIRKAEEEFPAVAGALLAVRSGSSGLRRAEQVEKVLRDARVLWVDDDPENSAWERELFRSFGVAIVAVESSRAALASIAAESFDVVISDIERDGEAADGIERALQIHHVNPALPIVLYVRHLTDSRIPPSASGITNEPNELLHLVLDRLERTRI
jgi:CheY-like chemotaxis protein